MTPQSEALRILEESLKELESPKGSVFASIQKLLRASILLNNDDIQRWCEIQLGESYYVEPLEKLVEVLTSDLADKKKDTEKILENLSALSLKQNLHYTDEELNIKADHSGGGYISIGFIEERYADLVRTKRGNDRTYYKNSLYRHLNYVRKKAHSFSVTIFNQLKFSGTVNNSFDVLKSAVDDKLLDINPELAEQLMLAFKGVSSNKSEEWSQGLTTCRRLLEGLADQLFPAITEISKGRNLGQSQYINRLWAFMDNAIGSDSNKEIAKSHIDFLGSWLEKINKITNKGVHTEVGQLEAIKTVFHVYLVVADLLEYINNPGPAKRQFDINSASLDEVEVLLDISRTTAKAIIKARIQNGKIDKDLLSKIPGIGPKTLAKAVAVFSL